MMLLALAFLLADGNGAGGGAGGAAGAAGQGGGGLGSMVPFIIVMAAAAYFLFYLPSKRERTRQATLFAGINKNDHVVTTSGIYGVVTDVNKESNKVTIRIDESTGAKMRMELTSIVRVLGDEPAANGSSK
jgi:preprotein translocase subunit YajC